MEAREVHRLSTVPQERVSAMHAEILAAGDVWTRQYEDFQSGGWLTSTLLGASRNPKDTVIADCRPQANELLSRCPVIAGQLRDLALSYMWVRVARMDPGASLWEHRDYRELHAVARYRLHIPLATNPEAFLVFGGDKLHLPAGGIYFMRPVQPHGACNLGREPRVHLILDVYEDAAIGRLLDARRPLSPQPLPRLSDEQLEHAVAEALALIQAGRCVEAETGLLRLYFRARFDEGALYDRLESVYRRAGLDETADRWMRAKRIQLGQEAYD